MKYRNIPGYIKLPKFQGLGKSQVTKNPKVNYIFTENNDAFSTEAKDLQSFLAKYYPEEQVQILSGYGDDYFNKQVTPILNNQIDNNDRFFLFGHHGSKYAGVSNDKWGELLENAQKRAGQFNCYLGSCNSQDLFLNPANVEDAYWNKLPVFDRVGNFYYRPKTQWLGVNPNAAKGANSDEGILNAMFTTTVGSPNVNFKKLHNSLVDLRSKLSDEFRSKNQKRLDEFNQFNYINATKKEREEYNKKRSNFFKEEETYLNSSPELRRLNALYQKNEKHYITPSPRYNYEYSYNPEFRPGISIDQRYPPISNQLQEINFNPSEIIRVGVPGQENFQRGGFFRDLFEGIGDFFKGIFGGKGGRGSFDCPGDVCSPGKMRFEKTGRSRFRDAISNLFGGKGSDGETPKTRGIRTPIENGSFTGTNDEEPEQPEEWQGRCFDENGNLLPYYYDDSGRLIPCTNQITITNYYNTYTNPYNQPAAQPTPQEQSGSPVYDDAIVQSPEARGAGSFDMQGNFTASQGNLARYGGIRTPNKRKKFRSY